LKHENLAFKNNSLSQFFLFGYEGGSGDANEVLSLLCQTATGSIFACDPGLLRDKVENVINKIGKKIDVAYSEVDPFGTPVNARFTSTKDYKMFG
jgi:hypothetical protein